jgi:hypothetical protein
MCVNSHAWGIEVRDALYDSVDPPVTLDKLQSLRNEGRSLRVVNDNLLSLLNNILIERSAVAKSTYFLAKQLSLSLEPTIARVIDDGIMKHRDGEMIGEIPIIWSWLQVQDLLARSYRLPRALVLHTHEPQLRVVHSYLENIEAEIQQVIYRAEVCSVRKQR